MTENTGNTEYIEKLDAALKERAGWLERSELPKLKEELRGYQTGFASLYNLYLKKGLIHEDPYKAEAKIGELEVPSSAAFSDAERLEQLTQRLANYDNQLDFLVNFYQFSADFLNLDRIKRILGLVKYVDWVHLSPDSQSFMTKVVSEMTSQIKNGSDSLTMSLISESLSHLNRSFSPIMGFLKVLTDYQKEVYKLELRDITSGMSAAEAANFPQLKKKFVQARPGVPFYAEMAEEVLKEDYSPDGPALREAVLKKLQVADAKPKAVKVEVSYKTILVEGIQSLGATAATFSEISAKLNENKAILESKKNGLIQKIRKLLQQVFNKQPDPVIYEVEDNDPLKGVPVREKVNFVNFQNELERKIRILSPVAPQGGATAKLEAMQEEQLTGFLERNVRDVQSLHKILDALDDFFKKSVDKIDREKIRGFKPELGTIKNAILRANSKRHEYSAQKEEEEQLKRLGVKPEP
jgi:DNA-binding MltR family transcriptional regulator